jgi:Transposase
MAVNEGTRRIVGGVDTHKDLHVAAVVDEQDRVIGTRSFATTRQGYRQMLAWMRSFGELQRIGVESTGSYGAGLLRFIQQAKVAVLEVTTPDKQDRRRRGKNDDLDAQNAAHAAFAGHRIVTPRSRDGCTRSPPVSARRSSFDARYDSNRSLWSVWMPWMQAAGQILAWSRISWPSGNVTERAVDRPFRRPAKGQSRIRSGTPGVSSRSSLGGVSLTRLATSRYSLSSIDQSN